MNDEYPGFGVEEPEGILLIDKPAGPTSHDVVRKVKKALNVKKAGHLGTLDPAATGLLAVTINGATKITPFMAGHEKEYRGVLKLGEETDTQDAAGKVVAVQDTASVTEEAVREAFEGFKGSILQRPPAFSAVKKGGVPLYKLARAGKMVQAPVKPVHVKELEIESVNLPQVTFRATVSAGTYIRTLAHDIGAKLGVGAHLVSLRRLRSGPFRIEDAVTLDEMGTGPGLRRAFGAIMPLRKALKEWPEILLRGEAARRTAHGGPLTMADFESGNARLEDWESKTAKAVDEKGRLIAVMEKAGGRGWADASSENKVLWQPLRVWGRE